MRFVFPVVSAACAVALIPLQTQAATLTYTVDALAGFDSEVATERDVADFAVDLDVAATADNAQSRARLIADHDSGAVAFSASSSTTPVGRTGSLVYNPGASSDWDIEERFTVSGSGSVTFTADYLGRLSRTPVPGFGQTTEALMELDLFAIIVDPTGFAVDRFAGRDRISQSLRSSALTSQDFDGRLSLTFDVIDGETFDLTLSGEAGALTAKQRDIPTQSLVDFLIGAQLGYTTSSGVSIFASDPDFLSGDDGTPTTPTTPSLPAVPLPASLPLLASALALIGLRRLG